MERVWNNHKLNKIRLSTCRSRKSLIKEEAKKPMVILEKLQRSTAQVRESVHRTTIIHVFLKSGLCGRLARRKLLLKESHKKFCSQFATKTANMWKKVFWSDVTKMKHLGLNAKRYLCEKLNAAHQPGDTITTGKHRIYIIGCFFFQLGLESCSELIGRWMK